MLQFLSLKMLQFQNHFYNSWTLNRENGTPAIYTAPWLACYSTVELVFCLAACMQEHAWTSLSFGYSLFFFSPPPMSFWVTLAPSATTNIEFRELASFLWPDKRCSCWHMKCCHKARRVLVRGSRAGNQRYKVVHSASRGCCISSRGAIIPVTSQ